MFLRTTPVIVLLAIASTLYLYLYPLFHGCAFPLPDATHSQGRRHSCSTTDNGASQVASQSAFISTLSRHIRLPLLASPDDAADDERAVFRLLVLADPQLEGDSSLPRPEDELLPRLRRRWETLTRQAPDIIEGNLEPRASLSSSLSSSSSSVLAFLQKHYYLVRHSRLLVLSAARELLGVVAHDIPHTLRALRKRIDLFGNDYYLAHVYRTMHWWSRPTHVAVLGDLLGSQWVSDEEFDRRSSRYWDRVFRHSEKVDLDSPSLAAASGGADEILIDIDADQTATSAPSPSWANKLINIVGNHDIGYAGDASQSRIDRFERAFGRANWDVRFRYKYYPLGRGSSGSHASSPANASSTESHNMSLPAALTPTLHLINLNSLILDTPALSSDVQAASYAFVNDLISHRSYPVEDRTTFTLLLTHLPLHKKEGVCTDAPYFSFFDYDDVAADTNMEEEADKNETLPLGIPAPRFKAGGLREQNHLSDYVSANVILQGIFGMSGEQAAPARGRGRNGLVLTGHDHTGCDVVHFVRRHSDTADDDEASQQEVRQSWQWDARRYAAASASDPDTPPSIREVTLRSMMGEYGGNAGLLSLWFDADPTVNEWKYEFSVCAAGVQQIWWTVHVLLLLAVLLLIGWLARSLFSLFTYVSTANNAAAKAAPAVDVAAEAVHQKHPPALEAKWPSTRTPALVR